MPLTDIKCKSIKPDTKARKLSDSNGLYLEVMPSGSKYWRMKYRFAGKEKRLALGVYPEVSLSEAREKKDQARKLLASNIDPSYAKKEAKLKIIEDTINSFKQIAKEWHTNQLNSWTERHARYVLRRLEVDIFPVIGSRAINKITAPELLNVLRIIEARGAIDIAHRALQTCGQIFRYAIVIGLTDRDISADLKGALKARKKTNYAHLEEKDLPEFLSKLDEYKGDLQTKLAVRLLILTFVRTKELREAKWIEFDLNKKEWRIPAERMKMRDKHIVPLSDQAVAVIEQLKLISSHSEYLFPNRNKSTTYMSENTILYALYRMGYYSRTTAHGFRATASTILNEHGFNSDYIERQLAHSERNEVRAAYNHAQYLPERKRMMQWWADFIDKQGFTQ